MSSIPQLKSDINTLQEKLSVALAKIAELEARPMDVKPVAQTVETVRVEYVDNPALIEQIRQLQSRLRGQ